MPTIYKYRVYLAGSPDDEMQITSLYPLKELVEALNTAAKSGCPFVTGRNGDNTKDAIINVNTISSIFPKDM